MTTLRARIVGALAGTVILAVGGAAVQSARQVSALLEDEIERRGTAAEQSLREELAQLGQTLDDELTRVFSDPGVRASAGRYLWAKERIDSGGLDILKVLGGDGAILTSGHWPASVGFLDPQAELYRAGGVTVPTFMSEPVPAGDTPSLQRWRAGRWAGDEVVAVVGRTLDVPSLERIRARLGVAALMLCPTAPAPCIAAKTPEINAPDRPLDVNSTGLRLHTVPLGTSDGPQLVIAVDRSRISSLTRALQWRAALLALGGALLVILPGGLIAARITRPIEALAEQAESLARGELRARVETQPGVTEVDALVTAFNGMARDLETNRTRLVQAERVAAWREIAQGLAHELKNPLTPILGAVDVIRRAHVLGREDFEEILREQAVAVTDEVMRLKELSDSFARFARLPDPRPEKLDPGALLDGIVTLYATADTLEVERSWSTRPAPPVRADPTQLRTALSNLVKNAVEAMESNGTLRLRVFEVEDGIRLEVEDSGPGIPKTIRGRLFTPYFTTKGSRGTGLGLALVHRIVLEHGGAIEATDAPNGGALFRLTLPRPAPRKP